MKPYDKSNSFMRRVTKRVSELIPGTTWMNMLLGESQSGDDTILSTKHNDQPPVKKLCMSNNTFVNNKMCHNPNTLVNSTDNLRNSHVHLPEISALTCLPGTSRQNPKFTSQSNSPLLGHDISNRSSSKRKPDVIELSNINRPNTKTYTSNFVSSTHSLDTSNEPLVAVMNSKRSLPSGKLFTQNEFSTSTSSKLIKPRENESQSVVKLHDTTNNLSSPSFKWDTFVNYGELSERQKIFAQKSPLNCSQVIYGGRSVHSNLFKNLEPPLHRKTVIPISPSNNSIIRTTSSILLEHISTKDKEIESNKFIIQPRMNSLLRHKSDLKPVPFKVETTVKIVDSRLKNSDGKSHNTSLKCFSQETSRKLRANISKKVRCVMPDKHEMPAKVDLPDISLPISVLPSIILSSNEAEDHKFTFNQPLTLEEFGLQIIEKTSSKNQQLTSKKIQSINTDSSNQDHQSYPVSSLFSNSDVFNKYPEKASTTHNDIELKNDQVSELCEFGNNSKGIFINNKSLGNSSSILEFSKPANIVFDNSFKVLESNLKKQQETQKLSVELKKWTCDTCWVTNDLDKIKCVACQILRSNNSSKPLKVSESINWSCETCWVPNKNETDTCVACQSQKNGSTKKVKEKCSTWTCDACWVNNKNECSSCISCGTTSSGFALDNKPQSLTQFNFGFNNNLFEKSGGSLINFGFVSGKTDQSCNQFKFGNPTFKFSENKKSDVCTTEFKFGLNNSESDKRLRTVKFGIDSAMSQPVKKPDEISYYSNNNDKPLNQFKFGFESKLVQPESHKFGINAITSKKTAQLNFFESDVGEIEKSVQQNVTTDSNKFKQSNNEFSVINDKSEI